MAKVNFDFILKERNDLHFVYNETKIAILPIDPAKIFIYWDISDNTIFDLKEKKIQLNIAIRLRNIGNHDYYFINPTSNSKDWYFHLKHTNLKKNNLVADLGVYDNNGDFFILATSNIINLPNDSCCRKNYNYWSKFLRRDNDFSVDFENVFLSQVNSMEFITKQ
jgi:hypothetical protein